MSASAFKSGSSEIDLSVSDNVEQVLNILSKRPSILRLAYTQALGESKQLAQNRLEALTVLFSKRWRKSERSYRLVIEQEIDSMRAAGRGR